MPEETAEITTASPMNRRSIALTQDRSSATATSHFPHILRSRVHACRSCRRRPSRALAAPQSAACSIVGQPDSGIHPPGALVNVEDILRPDPIDPIDPIDLLRHFWPHSDGEQPQPISQGVQQLTRQPPDNGTGGYGRRVVARQDRPSGGGDFAPGRPTATTFHPARWRLPPAGARDRRRSQIAQGCRSSKREWSYFAASSRSSPNMSTSASRSLSAFHSQGRMPQ